MTTVSALHATLSVDGRLLSRSPHLSHEDIIARFHDGRIDTLVVTIEPRLDCMVTDETLTSDPDFAFLPRSIEMELQHFEICGSRCVATYRVLDATGPAHRPPRA